MMIFGGMDMNCHEDRKENKGSHNHSPLKHMLHMALCCGLPILIIGLLPVITKFSPGAAKLLGGIAPFICPLMMFAMIPMMLGGRKKESCCDHTKDENTNTKALDQRIE